MSELLSWRAALQQVLDTVSPLGPETVATARGAGRVLVREVRAPWDVPQRDVSMMDGYAARSVDLVGEPQLQVVGESAAGHPAGRELAEGEAMRISTGAVVPNGADTVVPQEDTTRTQDTIAVDLGRYGEVRPGRWLRPRACDFAEGALVLPPGLRLGPGDVALAASMGHATIVVHRRPTVSIVSTGDELVPLGTDPEPGQVISSNSLMLAAQIEAAGGSPVDHGIAPDEPEALQAWLARALQADVVVTSGGISVGDHDLVRRSFEALGCAFEFHGIAVRPGKPTAFGRNGSTLVFGLPGNPASTLTTFALLVRPAIRRMLGVRGDVRPPTLTVRLRDAARGAGKRAHFVRAQLHADGTATPLTSQVSGDMRSIRDFDAFVEVPAGVEALAAGAEAQAVVFDPWWIERRPS